MHRSPDRFSTAIWDTPDNGYAEKFKHSIEPFLNLTRTSKIDNSEQNRQARTRSIKFSGGTTAYTYGLINRFYAKRRSTGGRAGRAGARDSDGPADPDLSQRGRGNRLTPVIRVATTVMRTTTSYRSL